MPAETALISRERIAATSRLIAPFIRRTPLIEIGAQELDLQPNQLILKLESLQHAGSFKTRGAFANLLMREVPEAGAVAASGGNHGTAVAYAAMRLRKHATIFVPSISSPMKIERIRSYGADLVVGGELYDDALAASQTWQLGSGALPVHAFDAVETMLGTGTLAEELSQQVAAFDTLLVPVGGGGLIGGLASWFEGSIKIIGVEPAGAPTLSRALEAGRPVETAVETIAADSLGPRRIGELTFPIARRLVNHVVLVEDDDIRAAQRMLWSRLAIVAEPGGAAAYAALLAQRYRPVKDERICVVISGANTTAVDFSR
jgi:threonine dehydratase